MDEEIGSCEIGIDLSHWSVRYWDAKKRAYVDNYNWPVFDQSCKNLNITRILTKLSGGQVVNGKPSSYIDATVGIIADGMRQLRRRLDGGFHWFDPRVNLNQQMDKLEEAYHSSSAKSAWIDIEQVCPGVTPREHAVKALTFLEMVEGRLGDIPGIYSAAWFWNVFIDGRYIKDEIKRYGKWVAHYTTRKIPYIPKYWDGWNMWQFTDRLPVLGLASLGTDANRIKPGVL